METVSGNLGENVNDVNRNPETAMEIGMHNVGTETFIKMW